MPCKQKHVGNNPLTCINRISTSVRLTEVLIRATLVNSIKVSLTSNSLALICSNQKQLKVEFWISVWNFSSHSHHSLFRLHHYPQWGDLAVFYTLRLSTVNFRALPLNNFRAHCNRLMPARLCRFGERRKYQDSIISDYFAWQNCINAWTQSIHIS